MKRKLDENDIPAVAEENEKEDNAPQPETEDAQKATPPAAAEETPKSFADFGLDFRLVQAIAQQKFEKPTLVQQKAIPLAVNGKDLLVKAKTGSGKTAAYLLPVLQAILKRKQRDTAFFTSALMLVPTRELADQVHKSINHFSAFCSRDITSINISNKATDNVLQSLLANMPDIVVSTPGRAWHATNAGFLSLDKLTHLVLDEADLVLSFGFNEDLENISATIPKHVQTILMSATLTTEVETLKGMLCRDPTVLDLVEKEAQGEGVTQYVVKCAEDEKFLLAYIIFKLKLVTGKCLIFVADVDRCYRLKLYFEQFGIRSCILNSELPVNSRIHCIEEFNRNVYDIIIASDEHELLGNEGQEEKEEKEGNDEAGGQGEEEHQNKKHKSSSSRSSKRKHRDKEFGVARGVDFKNVRAVINFDLPTTAKSYTHRIGRTARAGQTGMALSFVVPKEQYRKHMPTTVETAANDEKILARIVRQQAKVGKTVQPYDFDMKQVEAFRYRMNDALRSVTKVAVREARMREIRQELLKSEKLQRHFASNPGEMQELQNHLGGGGRHDTELRTVRTQSHLKHVPEYLLPKDGKNALSPAEVGFVPLRSGKKRMDRRKAKYFARSGGGSRGASGRNSNPLKTFRTSKTKR